MNNKSDLKRDELGVSEEFILPVAPPPQPCNPVRKGDQLNEPTPPPSSAGDGNDDSDFDINGTPLVGIAPSSASDATGDDAPIEDQSVLDDTLLATEDMSNNEPTTSSPLVAWLICAVVVLLVVIIIQFNQAADSESPPLLSSSGNDSELTDARNEIRAARSEIDQGERKIRDLEQKLLASQNTAGGKVASLLEKNKRLERLGSELSSEAARLKSQLQTATRPTTVSESPPPVQKTPIAQQDGQTYRVAGLRPGDTLNIRSGPGTNYPAITALQNGVRVTVTGAAVMNGPDSWLPCIIALSRVDPTTGSNRSWNQECWINSFFLEQIDSQ
jgi:hypothetical protein